MTVHKIARLQLRKNQMFCSCCCTSFFWQKLFSGHNYAKILLKETKWEFFFQTRFQLNFFGHKIKQQNFAKKRQKAHFFFQTTFQLNFFFWQVMWVHRILKDFKISNVKWQSQNCSTLNWYKNQKQTTPSSKFSPFDKKVFLVTK